MNKSTRPEPRNKTTTCAKERLCNWPELNYTTAPGVLILHPSTPAIPPAQQLSLVEKAPRVLTPRRKDETENIHRDLPKGD